MEVAMKHLLMYAIVLCLFFAMATHSQTWTSLNGPKLVTNTQAITLNNSGTPTLYVADADYIMKSTDGGTTWKGTISDYTDPVATACKFTDASIVVSTRAGHFRRSADGGSSWNTVTSSSGNIQTDLAPLRLTSATASETENYMFLGREYVSGNRAVWRSSNSGSTWEPSDDFEYVADVYDISTYPANYTSRKNYVFACGVNPSGSQEQSDPNTVASVNGVFFSPNNGDDWYTKKMGGYNTFSIAILDKGEGNNYYLFGAVKGGTEHGVYRSTDGGDSFEEDPVFDDASVNIIRINSSSSPKAIFLGTDDDIWRSTNDGADWTQVSSLGSDDDVISIAVSGSATIFAGTTGSIYKSTDNGTTWTDIGKMNVSSVAGYGNKVWAVTKDNAFVGTSADFGSSWTNQVLIGAGESISNEHVYRNPYTGHIFTSGLKEVSASIFRSVNEGSSFSEVYGDDNGGAIFRVTADLLNDDGTMHAVGGGLDAAEGVNWKHVFSSNNDGETWQPTNWTVPPGIHIARDIVLLNHDTIYAGLQSAPSYVKKSKNYGGSGFDTELVTVGNGAVTLAMSASSSAVIYAGGASGFKRSTNWGTTWNSSFIQSYSTKRILMNPRFPSSTDKIIVLRANGTIDSSDNGGTNVTSITRNLGDLGIAINDIQTFPNAGMIYAATEKGVYALNVVPDAPTGVSSAINSGHPYISWSNNNTEADLPSAKYKVYRYYFTCQTYCPAHSCGGETTPEHIATVSTTYYQDNTESVMSCSGGGIPDGMVGYFVRTVDNGGLESVNSQSVGFTLSGGNESTPNTGLVEPEVPLAHFLGQNYPNPFNPVTTIRYGLPEDGHVRLVVSDILGREVAVLVDQKESAGYKAVMFETSRHASGVYFYKLTAGTFTDIKKMIVTK